MKKILVLSMLISFVMICSCQRKESAAQQEFAQRTVELDAREEALAERKSALDEREKALAQKEQAAMNARTNPTDTQGQIPNPAQMQAERDRITQQLSVRAPEPSQLRAEKDQRENETQQQRGQSQSYQEEKLRAVERKWQAAMGMSGGAVFPSAQATSPAPSPEVEATPPSPSPTPQ